MRNLRLFSGIVLLPASIILVCLFFIPGYGKFYWSNPAVFVTFTVVGMFAAFLGSYFVRTAIFPGKRREKTFFEVLVIFGDIVLLLGLMATAGALYSSVAIAANPLYWGKYYGARDQYNALILASQVLFFWLSVALIIAGEFIIGLGHERKRPE